MSTLNPPTTRPIDSRLLRHRWKAALTIAAAEGVIAAVEEASRWILLGVALLVLLAYFRWGRLAQSALARRLAWIGAASQAFIVVLVLVAFFAGLLVLIAVAALVAVALALLVLDRGQ